MKNKSAYAAALLVLTASVITGCGGANSGQSGNNGSVISQESTSKEVQGSTQSQAELTDVEKKLWSVGDDMVYVPRFSELEYQGTSYNYFFYEGDSFYFLCGDEEHNLNVRVINSVSGQSSDIKLGEQMNEYVKTVDGYVGFTSLVSPKLTIYEAGFGGERQVDLSAFENKLKVDGIDYVCDSCQIDAQGNIGMTVGGNLYILDGDGQLLFSISDMQDVSQFYKLAVDGDGGMYVWGRNNSYERVAYRVDMQRQGLGDELSNLPTIEYDTVIYPVGDYSWYIATKNAVYLYNTADCSGRRLINLTDYGVSLNKYMSGFGTDEEENVVLISKEAYAQSGSYTTQVSEEDATDSADIIFLEAVSKDDVKERQELVIASVGNLPISYERMIRNFNKYNEDFYISIKNYVNEVSGENDNLYGAAREKLSLDIATGDGADLYYVSAYDVDFDSLSDKGVFADMYEYLDADDELGRDSFFPNVLSELEYNGALVRMCDSFAIDTLVGKAQLLDGVDRLDADTLESFMGAHQGMQLLPAGNEMATLNILTMYRLDEFSDGQNGGFDCEEFVRLLELAKDIPYKTEIDYDEQLELLHSGSALVSSEQISGVKDMQWLEKLFGEKVTYLGYPTKNSSSNLIAIPTCFAINNKSEYKDEVWEFVKGFLTLDAQKKCSNIPINVEAFEQVLSENDDSVSSYGMGDINVSIKGKDITDEQKQAYRELVYSASGTEEYDTALYEIVEEEVQSFFAGTRSAKETAAVIQNRVQLYLDEKN